MKKRIVTALTVFVMAVLSIIPQPGMFSTTVLAAGKPAAPQMSSATPDRFGVILKWKAVANASGYHVYYKKSSESRYKYYTTTKTNSCTVSYYTLIEDGYVNGKTAYDFAVTSYQGKSTNTSALSKPFRKYAVAVKLCPYKPSIVARGDNFCLYLRCSYADSFDVYKKSSSEKNFSLYLSNVKANYGEATVYFKKPALGVTYSFFCVAKKSGSSSASSMQSYKRNEGMISGLTTTQRGGKIYLSWKWPAYNYWSDGVELVPYAHVYVKNPKGQYVYNSVVWKNNKFPVMNKNGSGNYVIEVRYAYNDTNALVQKRYIK